MIQLPNTVQFMLAQTHRAPSRGSPKGTCELTSWRLLGGFSGNPSEKRKLRPQSSANSNSRRQRGLASFGSPKLKKWMERMREADIFNAQWHGWEKMGHVSTSRAGIRGSRTKCGSPVCCLGFLANRGLNRHFGIRRHLPPGV